VAQDLPEGVLDARDACRQARPLIDVKYRLNRRFGCAPSAAHAAIPQTQQKLPHSG